MADRPPGRRSDPDTTPGRSPEASTIAAEADTSIDGEDAAAMLRRRREASWRLPPLADGRRDPLDQRGAA